MGLNPYYRTIPATRGESLEIMAPVGSVPVPEEECPAQWNRQKGNDQGTCLWPSDTGFQDIESLRDFAVLVSIRARPPPHFHSSSRVARTAEIFFLCVISTRSPLTEAGHPGFIATRLVLVGWCHA